MAVKKGQEYEAVRPNGWGHYRRIRVTSMVRADGRVRVSPVYGGHDSMISTTSLHEDRNTLMGKPWKTGYVLVKDIQD